ncbi:MAG: hypothetical protein U1B30_03490, partial [Pseudomonadota bacterium]|nr:hypothetical protein [Pseudomonadota bacterium]
ALLSITGGDIPEEERQMLNNLASRVFYGVSDENAIALRLLGIPRMAAEPLASQMQSSGAGHRSLFEVRNILRSSDAAFWIEALGLDKGQVYRKVWRVLEGLD